MQRGHPNYTLQCGSFKSFTSLDNITLKFTVLSNENFIPYAAPKYRTDGETSRYRSAHPREYLRASGGPPQPSPLEDCEYCSTFVSRVLARGPSLGSFLFALRCLFQCLVDVILGISSGRTQLSSSSGAERLPLKDSFTLGCRFLAKVA